MKIRNPILSGFHPDPSICKVKDTYYLANSTFEWFPGVELSYSKDLCTWRPLPSPLQRKTQLDMTGCEPSCGIWAPCLSYDGKLFYLIYTNVRTWNRGPWKDTPNFLVTAEKIEGPWSEPVYLNSSGFDPSLFHDTDGKKYLVNMEWDYRWKKERNFSGILLQEYDPVKKRPVGAIKKIFTGTDIGFVEGPHIFKRNGYYYLLTAEGCTFYNHAASIARSKNIEGPYEIHPSNPLISSRGDDTLAIQKAGHASLCDYKDGLWALVFLCGRPLPGTTRCVLGRETSLALVKWQDDWPYVVHNDGSAANTPEPYVITDNDESEIPHNSSRHYDFKDDGFYDDFKYLRTVDNRDFFKLKSGGGLEIRGGESPCSTFHKALLARRQTDFSFTAVTRLHFEPESFQHMAGLTYYYDENLHYYFAVTKDEKKGRCLVITSMDSGVFSKTPVLPIPEKDVYLKLEVEYARGTFSYSPDNKEWVPVLKDFDTSILSDDYFKDSFTGAFIGMMCTDTAAMAKCADFLFFDYNV
ncbi:glycoside hydrolase family 43 protein [Treponema parvum]|uniref:Glycoside hydrolase family 43 protein n=1 Tax=Treponema parvum TaxID=138851 RepID=A0A975EYW8_9SPIR|nr:glycoside hydrolase family 43 protein [Treponema parvum]QTQ10944.1 glycoside hydrolase family 43 protein [Treponema parvum]